MLEGRGGRAQRFLPGAVGFIGYHLTNYLMDRGQWVRGGDLNEPQPEHSSAREFQTIDLRRFEACVAVASDVRRSGAGKTIDIRHQRTTPRGMRGYSRDDSAPRHGAGSEPRASRSEGPARKCAPIPQQSAQHRARIEVRACARASPSGRAREHITAA